MFVQSEFTKTNHNNNNNNHHHHKYQMTGGGGAVVVAGDSTVVVASTVVASSSPPHFTEALLKDLDLVSRFCVPVCSRDNEIREMALDAIAKTVEGWLDGVGSPRHRRPAANNGALAPSTGEEYSSLVALHLPIVLRLSISCPFANVREKCQHILQVVQSRGLPIPYPNVVGPSSYIAPEELPALGNFNENTHTLFVDAFLQNNRLDHVSQVMGYHPLYLDNFLKTQHFILRGDGPLPYDYRHYIAIMAAGRHQCSYLITLQKQEFILQGGDHKWLQGLNFIPPKLRNLYDINKILAHRPWLLNMSHIEKLTKGKDSWSLAEVVHAIVILAHFHSLCSFVFSCGVNQELDQAGGYRYPSNPPSNGINGAGIGGGGGGGHLTNGDSNPSENSNTTSLNLNNTSDPKDIIKDWNNHHHSSTNTLPPILDPPPNPSSLPVSPLPPLLPPSPTNAEPEVAISTLMARMKTLSEQPQECSPGELAKRFEHVCEETNTAPPPSNNITTTVPAPVAITRATVVSNNKVVNVGSGELLSGERVVMNGGGGKEDRVVDGREEVLLAQDLVQRADIVCGFVFDPSYGYQDFAKRGEPQLIPTFRVQDYSWDDHAYSLVNRLYNDVGNLLDDTFRTAYNLTYYTMGGRTDVDTSRFRRAIWNYIQCLLGVRHDDYDYGEINQLLERTLKTFIKGACCFPERVTKRDYDRVLREFKDSEKVHVNLMVLEARKQAELLYALRTVNKYMNN